MESKASYMVVTTNFELEQVLQHYLTTYPDSPIENFQIVYQLGRNDDSGETSYIVVFTRSSSKKGPRAMSIWDFITAYCQVNDRYAIAALIEHGFPNKRSLKQMHLAGRVPTETS